MSSNNILVRHMLTTVQRLRKVVRPARHIYSHCSIAGLLADARQCSVRSLQYRLSAAGAHIDGTDVDSLAMRAAALGRLRRLAAVIRSPFADSNSTALHCIAARISVAGRVAAYVLSLRRRANPTDVGVTYRTR
jgi:hypothetical protein